MVAVITRPAVGSPQPRLTLIPGGHAGTPVRSVVAARERSDGLSRAALSRAALSRGGVVPAPVPVARPRASLALAPVRPGLARRAVQGAARYHRTIAYGLLALAIVAGLWMVVRAMGGVAGGGPLTSSGAPGQSVSGQSVSGQSVSGSPAPAAVVSPDVAEHPTQGRAWTVQPGNTLWGIVEAAGVKGDIRPVVDRLSAQLHGQPLQVGDVITVP